MSPIIRPVDKRKPARYPWIIILFSLLALMMMLAYSQLDERSATLWLNFWGVVPADLLGAVNSSFKAWSGGDFAGLFGALFAHASWLHLIGNLAYLWVFGISVERKIGHGYFLMAFLLLGALANLLMALQTPDVGQPVIGASGAVSAVIGMYLGLFPNGRIGLWLPLGLYLQFARIPALLVIGSWFTLQLIYSVFGPVSGAVAWWTHVAGFLAGLLATLMLRLFLRSDRHHR
ncbi:MAG: rhomboid family intramembrane serine protease [Pseudomonadota bacterium]